MELKKIDTFFLKMLYLVEAGIVVTQVLRLDRITSLLFLLTFVFTVLLWIRTIRQTFSANDLLVVITAALAVIGVLLNAVRSNADLSFDYLKKLIMFIMALLFFQTAFRLRANDEFCVFLRRTVDFLTLFLIVMYFIRYGQMHMVNGIRTIYLTFNFSNPNLTALFLMGLYMLKAQQLFEQKKWFVKVVDILQQLLLAWFIVDTQSRNCLLVLFLYTVVMIWVFFRKSENLRITKGWAMLFAIFPALLVAVYMLMIDSKWILETFSFLVGEGKKLSSRVEIWGQALQFLRGSPVFGAYYEISKGTGSSQMHNTHLDIATSYGIPVLILVCVLLTKYLHQQGRIYDDKNEYIHVLGFACMIALGMGEAAMFSGGLGIYIIAGTSLLLANREDEIDASGE